MTTMDDVSKLIKEVKKGNLDAFGQLYELYVDQIFRYVFCKTGNIADAEDLTEQVFLQAFENIKGYKVRGLPFTSWLYKIAHNLVVDHYRHRAKTSEVALKEEQAQALSTAENPEALLVKNAEFARLYQALQKLTDEQREVVVLRFLEGLSTAEVAKITDRSEGAVRSVQWRALQALSSILFSKGISKSTSS